MTPQEELARKLRFEVALARRLRRFFRIVNKFIIRGIRTTGGVPRLKRSQLLDLEAILRDHYLAVGAVFGNQVRRSNPAKQRLADLLTKELDDTVEDELELFATVQAAERALAIMETTEKEAQKSLAQALAVLVEQQEELVAANIAREAQRHLQTATRARIPMISATETQNAAEGVKRIEADVINSEAETEVVFKTWDTNLDGRERPTHNAADGQRIRSEQPFTVGGARLMYPGDTSLGAPLREIINCRCSARYDVERNG